MTLFGELPSESPRLPSPWLSRSSGTSPSPLSHSSSTDSGSSTPSTPVDGPTDHDRGRRRSSVDELTLLDDFEALAVGQKEVKTEEIVFEEDGRIEGLMPEVDHEGHIEYKLMLPTPTSQHRLEKLRTQLKWRLSEGGGQAVYEIGVLDDGKLVGLTKEKMVESLETLRRMLAGLGGGRINISRVLRIAGTDDVDSPAPSSPTSALFPSCDVLPSTSDLDLCIHPSLVAVSASPPDADALAFFPPEKVRGPVPFPSTRTAEEQLAFRRDKRDQRRARREAAGVFQSNASPSTSSPSSSSASSTTPSGFSSPFPAPAPSLPISIPLLSRSSSRSKPFHTAPLRPIPPRQKPPKAPKPPRSERSSKRAAPNHPPPMLEKSRYAPVLPANARGETRFIVEAVVHKAEEQGGGGAGGGKRSRERRKSSSASTATEESDAVSEETGSEDEKSSSGGGGEDEEEDGEGWDYLEFDLASLSTSVKSAAVAAAAEAAAGGGGGAAGVVVRVGA